VFHSELFLPMFVPKHAHTPKLTPLTIRTNSEKQYILPFLCERIHTTMNQVNFPIFMASSM